MLAGSETIATSVDHWLGQFERALAEPDDVLLKTLFHPDSHWRDVLALTWHIRTVNGLDTILRELNAHVGRAHPTCFRTDPHRTAPRYVTRAGTKALEAIFRFETAEGRGSGVVRLTPDANDGDTLRAWTLLTALDEIKGFAEQVGRSRPSGKSYSRDFRGPNWLDLRRSAAEYVERDPVVLVVGGGQAGLSIAARLRQLQVDTLIVDRGQRVGDNWRNRYHALTLHNQVQVNHLPYMPFPRVGRPTFPKTNWPVGSRPMWKAWSSTTGRPRSSRAARTTKEKSDGPSCYGVRTAPSARCVRDTSSWQPESAAFRIFPLSRRCATSAARFCTPANTTTARHGKAGTSLSSAPATAATILRRTCTRAAQRSLSFSAIRR